MWYLTAVKTLFAYTYEKLFRHGNRTPDAVPNLYVTDPYKNHDYYPYGKGELKNVSFSIINMCL